MARNLAAFAAACTGLGCNTPLPDPWDSDAQALRVPETIVISSACTDAEISSIVEAVEEWHAAIPELRGAIDLADPRDPAGPEVTVHCDMWPEEQEHLLARSLAIAWERRVWINRPMMAQYAQDPDVMADLRVVVLHELGHHYGAPHLSDGTVMAPGYPDAAHHLTASDIAAVRDAHVWGPRD